MRVHAVDLFSLLEFGAVRFSSVSFQCNVLLLTRQRKPEDKIEDGKFKVQYIAC